MLTMAKNMWNFGRSWRFNSKRGERFVNSGLWSRLLNKPTRPTRRKPKTEAEAEAEVETAAEAEAAAKTEAETEAEQKQTQNHKRKQK